MAKRNKAFLLGDKVDIIAETDDPQWPERFGSSVGFVCNPMGKRSRWVIVEVTEFAFQEAIGSGIRFPKSSLRHYGDL